jgi:hypothetical protein
MNEEGNSRREGCPAARYIAPVVAGLVSIVDWQVGIHGALGTR